MSEFQPLRPERVLAIGAHADDIDFGASGSVAKWAADGADIHYVVITDGSKGTADGNLSPQEMIATREAEQRSAAQTLGVTEVHFLRYEDATLEVTMGLKKDLVRLIRQLRPDTVVVMDPTVVYYADFNFINHPDHRAAGQATLDAVFPLARDHLSFPDLLSEEQLQPHKVAHVLLINLKEQNFFVDISSTMDAKIAGLMQHVSQMADADRVISMLRERAAALGAHTGSRYAEGFMRIDPQS